MIPRKLILCALVAGGLAGCGDAHLGELYGRRTRGAFDAQAQAQAPAKGADPGALDADDAKLTLARQRGRGALGAPGAASASGLSGSAGFGGGAGGAPILGGSGGGAPAPSTPYRLDAIR
jgi:hypothetical protein